jgi:acetyltransferase-like isoleucine patch superfamily enzyme
MLLEELTGIADHDGELARLGATPGFGLPAADAEKFELESRGDRRELERRNVFVDRLRGDSSGNRVFLSGRLADRLTVAFQADATTCSDNTLFLGDAVDFHGNVTLGGSGNLLVLCGPDRHRSPHEPQRAGIAANVQFHADRQLFYWGPGSTCNGGYFVLAGPGTSIAVGEDCLLSREIWVRTYDSHAAIDLKTGERVNAPASIMLEPHVWVGQQAFILKGVRVGYGAVVAARSLLTSAVPPKCSVAGSPARVIRENVSWTFAAQPSEAQTAALRQRLERYQSMPSS